MIDVAVSAAFGPEGAPLLVLGPSLGTTSVLWESVLPALVRDHRVITWELPGHGSSGPAREAFSVAELADALVRALAESLDGARFDYAGVSLGGAVGLELLLRHPQLVGAAAILCSGAVIGTPQGWRDRAARVRAQSTSSLVVGSAQRWFAPGSVAEHPELAGRLLHALQDADDESYALACEALAAYDVRDRLGEIGAPVLAVWGAHDAVTPEASAREIATGVRSGSAVGIPGASHLAPVDDPAAVSRLLGGFLTPERTPR
ncbi:MAG: alpha/beta hydrolase [Microbacterium sp. 14-71-5]|jgi:3-oxoadipate enol-lactonase|uniref:alpha/beta fold hydrolase n=1 Tax=Microbacterium sp. 13-71-7 TaxID=1970399 RepID=UPI000BCA5B0E|nr:alpha/beta fold hydrolase [Microbacterium sp. 13-71-7]OZB84266.1 MAG: alpha/beta hydrolase [Microbacterium sp. 14-71-5]OZB85768.1 MAG: alpha/beta hydrolase [Microbacterium sp. 13-71-7]